MKYEFEESKYLEFKENIDSANGFRALAKECVAFANAVGGSVVIGIRDKDLEVIGLDADQINRILESASEAVFSLTLPPIQIIAQRKLILEKEIVVIKVPRGLGGVFRLRGSSTQKEPYVGVFVRVGRSSMPITTQEQYDSLLAEKKRLRIDEQLVVDADSYEKILSSDEIKQAFGRSINEEFLLSNKILARHSINHEDLHPTTAAIIAFSGDPSRYISEALIRVSHMKGKSGRQIISSRDITGSIRFMIEESIRLITDWTETSFKLEGATLKGVSPIPQLALREALVNAVVHRKYEYHAPIKVAIFDNRLEIFSPGDIPAPLLPHNLGDGSSQLRNHLLAKFSRQLRLIESLGSGIRIMREECNNSNLAPPEFHNEGDFVKVIFYFEKIKTVALSPTQAFDILVKTKTVITAADLIVMEISSRSASRLLKDKTKAGVLERVGENKGAKYIVVEKLIKK